MDAGKPGHPSILARALDVDPQELLDMAAAGHCSAANGDAAVG